MGKGQPVSWTYVGMRWGWPQPITTTSVGIERAERDSGVMEDAKVRRYSWQFCACLSVTLVASKWSGGGHAYATEKVPYEYYKNPARPILVVGIQALEDIFLLVLVQDGQICDFVQISFGRWVVIGLNIGFEVGGRIFDSHLVESRSRIFAYSIDPENERDESDSKK